jgi:endonuclease/exonuclease/phosphatase family metal-dependent hydrolase
MRRLPVRVVTWNLHGVPLVTSRREERMGLAGDRLHNARPEADLILVQEVFFPSDLKILKRHIGHDYLLVDDMPRRAYPPWFIPLFNLGGLFFRFRESGLAAFVHRRWQVLSSHFEEFRAQGSELKVWEGDGYAHKGFHRIDLLHFDTRRRLTVFNTHTQSLRAEHELRGLQISQLATAAYAVDSDIPVLLAGDFNVRPEEPLYNVMTKDFRWIDLTKTMEKCSERLGYEEGLHESVNRRRDYVFALPSAYWHFQTRANFICNLTDDVPYSDHHGIEAAITVRERRWQDELSSSSLPMNLPLGILAAQTLRGPSTRRAWLLALAASLYAATTSGLQARDIRRIDRRYNAAADPEGLIG